MRVQHHPTHHDGYRPPRVITAVVTAVAGVFGFLATLVRQVVNLFDRCRECRGIISCTRMGYEASYDPRWRCGVRWTCGCHKE